MSKSKWHQHLRKIILRFPKSIFEIWGEFPHGFENTLRYFQQCWCISNNFWKCSYWLLTSHVSSLDWRWFHFHLLAVLGLCLLWLQLSLFSRICSTTSWCKIWSASSNVWICPCLDLLLPPTWVRSAYLPHSFLLTCFPLVLHGTSQGMVKGLSLHFHTSRAVAETHY